MMNDDPYADTTDLSAAAQAEAEEHTTALPPMSWQATPTTEDPPVDTRVRVGYLVTGLIFLGIAGLWLAQEAGVVGTDDLDVAVPLLLILVGAAGLAAGLARSARRS